MTRWIRPKYPPSKENLTRQFEVEWDISNVQKMSFADASDYTAQQIAAKHPNLYLSLSGGMDSIYVADVLYRNRIPFVPVIIDYFGKDLDVWYAHHWCDQHNIRPLVYIITGYNNHDFCKRILRYATKNSTSANMAYSSNFIVEIVMPIDGALLTGGGEPFHVAVCHHDLMEDSIEFHESCYYMQMSYGDQHPGSFFNYTPELLFSMVRESDLSMNTQEIKSKLYQLPFRTKQPGLPLGWGPLQPLANNLAKDKKLETHKIKKVDFLALVP